MGEGFTRKPPKYERFIRPMALRYKKAHVTHPELGATFCLHILGVKKNPSSPMYTQLGVMTKGTVIEVNVSELGLVTQSGKVVWGKYAQITNNPENDGVCLSKTNNHSASMQSCWSKNVIFLIVFSLKLNSYFAAHAYTCLRDLTTALDLSSISSNSSVGDEIDTIAPPAPTDTF